MKDPAFLFYPGDFNEGTQYFTNEEVGAYLRILLLQFSHGRIPFEYIKRKLGEDCERLWTIFGDKFSIDEFGLYYNQRLEYEQEKRKKHCEHQKNNINKRWKREL